MHPDQEAMIERAVRTPAALSAGEREAVEHLLATDPAARALAEAFQAFYDTFETLGDEVPGVVAAFVDRLMPPAHVIPLRPLAVPPKSGEPTVLAAMTPPAAARRFEHLATLAAEEDEVLVRLLWDRATETGRLYTVAATAVQQAHVWLSLPALGLDLFTDERGRLDFPLAAAVAERDWSTAQAVLHAPLGAVEAEAAALMEGPVAYEVTGRTVTIRYEAGHLTVALDAGEPPVRVVLLEMKDALAPRPLMLPLTDGQSRYRLDVLPVRFIVRLYP